MKLLTCNWAMLGLAMAAPVIFASGTFLPEGSSPGVGMAGAGDVVNTSSAAVIWSNPAAMAGLEREMISFNAMLFNLGVKFRDKGSSSALPGQGDGQDAGGWLPSGGFFWHKPLDEKVSFGLGIGSLGGAKLDYGQWRGDLWLQKNSLMSLQLNPSLSYRLNDQWSVGGGVQMNYARFEMETRNLKMHNAGDTGYGYNLGLFYQPGEKFRLGLSYRSKVDHTFKDQLDVKVAAAGITESGEYELSMPYVAQASFGGSYQVSDRVKLLASVGWQQWRDLDRNPVVISNNKKQFPEVGILRNWKDVWQYAAGVEYQLNPQWILRAGISYETSPLDDPTLQSPDLPVDRQIRYALGAGTRMGQWDVNLFYQYADMGNPQIRKTDPRSGGQVTLLEGGFVDCRIHFAGVSASLKF